MEKEQKLRYKRFTEAFEYLKEIGRIDNQKDLAEILHKTPETISRVVKGSGNNPTEKFMFDFAKAFAREINEEYLMEGIGELVRTIPENEQYNLSDQRYIEQLENKLKKAEDEVQFYKQQIKLKDEQYRDARNDIERLNRIIEQLLPRQENKKDLASVG